ncbi:MAG: LptF/LptG family permease, partial [Pseudomonadales bacterium]|nr:LptF/LptG family permease [Pseudomonadales bacterium]
MNESSSTQAKGQVKAVSIVKRRNNLTMGVLSRYVNRELVAVFLLVFMLLVCVGLGGRFVGLLQDAAGGRYTTEAVWWLIGLRIPTFLQLMAPLSLFLALVITFGRLHADQEF